MGSEDKMKHCHAHIAVSVWYWMDVKENLLPTVIIAFTGRLVEFVGKI